MRPSVGLALAACSSGTGPSDFTVPIDASHEAAPPAGDPIQLPCTSGPARDPYARLPVLAYETPRPMTTKCGLRCGDTSKAEWGAGGGPDPTFATLPNGPCTNEATCYAQAVLLTCPLTSSDPPVGDLHQVVCRCDSGTWQCESSYWSGGRNGGGPCPDAGAR